MIVIARITQARTKNIALKVIAVLAHSGLKAPTIKLARAAIKRIDVSTPIVRVRCINSPFLKYCRVLFYNDLLGFRNAEVRRRYERLYALTSCGLLEKRLLFFL